MPKSERRLFRERKTKKKNHINLLLKIWIKARLSFLPRAGVRVSAWNIAHTYVLNGNGGADNWCESFIPSQSTWRYTMLGIDHCFFFSSYFNPSPFSERGRVLNGINPTLPRYTPHYILVSRDWIMIISTPASRQSPVFFLPLLTSSRVRSRK